MKTRFIIEWNDAEAVERFAKANGYTGEMEAASDRGFDLINCATYDEALEKAAEVIEKDFFGIVRINRQILAPSLDKLKTLAWMAADSGDEFDSLEAISQEVADRCGENEPKKGAES